MNVTQIAAVLRKAADDMEALAREGEFAIPDEMVLRYIVNFLTDTALRKLRLPASSQ
jgi:hypothetical protein